MAGAAEVVAAVGRPPGVVRTALVPNRRGAELALDAGVDELTVTISASAAYNAKNVHMTVDESVAATAEIAALAVGGGRARRRRDLVRLRLALRGRHRARPRSRRSAERLLDAGATRLTLADTTGHGHASPHRRGARRHGHRTSGCTCTRPVAPGCSTSTPGLQRGVAAVRHRRRRARRLAVRRRCGRATWPPKRWWRCSTTSAWRPASTSTG